VKEEEATNDTRKIMIVFEMMKIHRTFILDGHVKSDGAEGVYLCSSKNTYTL
jgi:hypothetical protein